MGAKCTLPLITIYINVPTKPTHVCQMCAQAGAECDAGRVFCEETYRLESNGFIAAVAWMSFARLDAEYNLWREGGKGMPLLALQARKAAALVLPVWNKLKQAVVDAEQVLAGDNAAAEGGRAEFEVAD
jgi:hypothetical protein